MNKRIALFLMFLGLPGMVLALNNFIPQEEFVGFDWSSPPASLYITDAQGQRAGADPALSFIEVGQQGDGLHGLEEIPNSVTEQENIQNGLTGQPSKHTHWSVLIPDRGKQSYTVNITGFTAGQGVIEIYSELVKTRKAGSTSKIAYLATLGSTKQFTVNYNPASSSAISVTPIVSNDDLLNDVKTAYKLHLITSNSAYDFLQKTAEEIQVDMEKRQEKEAEGLVLEFLYALGEPHPFDYRGADDQKFVKEPALSILKEDAQALLAKIQKSLPPFHRP